MLNLPRLPLMVSALIALCVSSAHAQIMSADTIGLGYNNNNGYISGVTLGDETALTQTFTGVTSIDTLTFRFIAPTSGVTIATSLDVYFSEWVGSDAPVATSIQSTISLPDVVGWTADGSESYLDYLFDMSSVGTLTSSTTYGLTIVGNATTVSGAYRLGGAGLGSSYGDGAGFSHSGVTTYGDLQSGGSAAALGGGANDFAFIANTAGGGVDVFAVTPVPEASTVAVLFAGLFVGGMAAFRVRQRRQQLAMAVEA